VSRREQLLQVIEQDLQQDSIDYSGLQQLMQDLYQQLLARNCQSIDRLNEQIEALLAQLRVRAQRRSKILTAFGLRSGAEAMQQLFKLFPERQCAQLQQRWERLAQLVGQCKSQNERNGKLMAMHNDILSQLLGENNKASLYTAQYF
jgi:flagella synthesis protein FlgN